MPSPVMGEGGGSSAASENADGLTLKEGLLSTTVVDVNTTDAQDLYEVPAGKTLVVTRIIVRNASTDLSIGGALNISFIESGLTTGVATAVNVQTLSVPAQYRLAGVTATYSTVTAGNKVQADPGSAFGSAATVTVDLFGYFIP